MMQNICKDAKLDFKELDSYKPNSHIVLNDSTSNYINKRFSKAFDLLFNKFNEAKVDESETKSDNMFKAKDDESKAEPNNNANSV
ncbi:4768_t:CDS:2 [Racocetra fulgida]|uniref:4768_t:CDS:1 n=1 Tax=Racocetra fulgida TaxID=60492 RepID=A0A9N9BNG8_9GLOM|nr:4768_t:CDS:2 [Racocetra fulgida]